MPNINHPQLIIEDSLTKDLITTCGFICIDNDPKSVDRQAAFALVEVDPDIVGFTRFKVWEVA